MCALLLSSLKLQGSKRHHGGALYSAANAAAALRVDGTKKRRRRKKDKSERAHRRLYTKGPIDCQERRTIVPSKPPMRSQDKTTAHNTTSNHFSHTTKESHSQPLKKNAEIVIICFSFASRDFLWNFIFSFFLGMNLLSKKLLQKVSFNEKFVKTAMATID